MAVATDTFGVGVGLRTCGRRDLEGRCGGSERATDDGTRDPALALVLDPESLSCILCGLEVPASRSSGCAVLCD